MAWAGRCTLKLPPAISSAALAVSLDGPEMERMANMHRGGDSQNKYADKPGYPGSYRLVAQDVRLCFFLKYDIYRFWSVRARMT